MNANPIGLLAVGTSLVAFVLCYTNLRARGIRLRLALLALFALGAIPSVLFAVYYLHVLPEWAWFYTLRSWRGTEFLVVFLGLATGALASLLPRFLLGLPLSVLLALAMVPYVKPFMGSLPDSEFREKWEGDVCLQSTSSTCGPASVSTILRHLGANPSERAAARAAYTYIGGTEAWYLARYVRSMGFVPRFDFRETFTPEAGLPAMVGVRLGGVGHFIAVLDATDGQVVYADPLVGERHLPLSEFQCHYTFTGFHMVIRQAKANAWSAVAE